MVFIKKTTIGMALALAFGSNIGLAEAATYGVTGGSLTISGSPASGALAGMAGQGIAFAGGGSLVEGSYQGYLTSPSIFPDAKLYGNDGYFITFTDAPGVAPSINWSTNSANLSSFYASWIGLDYAQGGGANVSNLGGGNYQLAWSALFANGTPGAELDGYTGNWTMNISGGPIPEVPVPASLWLLGSGLVGLAGVARRKIGV